MNVTRVLETCLYAPDLASVEAFYTTVLGLDVVARVTGRHVFFRCGDSMLLVFNPAATSTVPPPDAGVTVPPHGATGPGHVAFAVPEAEIAGWRDRLAALGVVLEAEIAWPRGGRSLYVRDPAGNSVELASPQMWGLPESGGCTAGS